MNKVKSHKGVNNPNFKYPKDLSMFYDMTYDGAYIIGMIWSDGHIEKGRVHIYQNEKYGYNINAIANKIFGTDDVVKRRDDGLLYLSICDSDFVSFLVSIGGIIGKKDSSVTIPNISEKYVWSFICGYFDGDGGFKYNYKYPEISITSNSITLLEQIAGYWDVNYNGGSKIYASGYKALDICGNMYEKCSFRNNYKYNYYMDILNWEPLPGGRWYDDVYFKCKKLDKNAVIPRKKRVTDSGYDIFAVDIYKHHESPLLYVADTRIAVEPIPGHYFDMIGRSSLPLSGFVFVGGVGVIDRSYTGSIKMLLHKIDAEAVLPETPFKCGQLIPRRVSHCEFKLVEELSDTNRGAGGFGSTGK